MPESAASFRKSLPSMMALSGWLSSWAMPALISPRVFILLAWMSCCSVSSRVEMSDTVTR